MRKAITLSLMLVFLTLCTYATHQRAGEITYKYLSPLTYEVTIVTYTFTPSLADRPELELHWGDGAYDVVDRVEKIDLPNNVSRNTYTYNGTGTGGRHTYPAPGSYMLWLEDPNRNAGIFNIPNSVNIPFYIETELVINPFLGENSSPVLLNPPIDNACVFQPFVHNPWAYDPDGDSLSYRIDSCKGQGGYYIPGYIFPPANNSFGIDAITGDLLWDSPQLNGEYNICIIIDEWRHGIHIGSVRRDMQITVVPCNNHPPQLVNIHDTCVLAGTYLSYNIVATDPDAGDVLTLTGNGGPLVITNSPAQFPQPVQGTGTVSSLFTWQTECSHVKKQPYQVNFKVEDNSQPVSLVDFASLRITVVGPAPENLSASPFGNTIHLKWDRSKCSNAIGYKVYRRNGYYGFFPGNCETGIPAYTGYVEIADVPGLTDTTYIDDNNGAGLIRGYDYCYMVYAYYPDGAESYASLEACAQLTKDVPVITHASVRNTDAVNGSMFVAWSKPVDFDTIQIPGPFKYLIYRGPNLSGALTLIDSLAHINDTAYIDSLINTADIPQHYRIDFYNDTPGNRFYIGATEEATSTYLTLIPSDNTLTLNWALDVPWTNDYYAIYRKNPSTLLWDSIGKSFTTSYADTGLVNGVTHCYKVKGVGHYSAPGFANPLINYSEEKCGIPVDNEAPCPPTLTVTPDCQAIKNILNWYYTDKSCAQDVNQYNIYYSPDQSNDYLLIFSTNSMADTFFVHSDIFTVAGCYYITAVDSTGNESAPGELICVDIDLCHLYELPNVFTPNGDGVNDYFTPFPYDFVEKIDIQIFNRWGKVIFHSTDPAINWNGDNQNSGIECADGVYYFVCDVWERRLGGLAKRTITGWVHLLR
jgi:gliding motility-associated-like protein